MKHWNARPTACPKIGLTSPDQCRRLRERPETGPDVAAPDPTAGTRRQQLLLTMPKCPQNETERHQLCPREDGMDDHLLEGCVVPQPIQLGGGQFRRHRASLIAGANLIGASARPIPAPQRGEPLKAARSGNGNTLRDRVYPPNRKP